ncbi:protein kinase-like protein [Euroglyphus maynei]|uniref:Protein kinase-like protein n=1 Tax=Euroglyphus maynei TaxID=6958 RepID=A0A1Y3BFP0_EURMA|nr:protein kinase-like protein [Euroglyphus maynei]
MNLNESNRLWVTKCLKHEMFISKSLHHTNIVRTYDYFKTNSYAVIIMEYYENGNIRQEMDRQNRPYDIREASHLFTGLIAGLQYMHGKNIAHRDLKLDNFFLDENHQPLIGDFGFATIGMKHGRLIIEHLLRQTRCGSDGYMAPEIARITNNNNEKQQQQYNAKKADVYSMGVCLYEMLHQTLPPPNIDNNNNSNNNTTMTGNHHSSLSTTTTTTMSLSFASNINERWKNLIKSMLNLEPNERPTIEQISYQISTPLFTLMSLVQRSNTNTKIDKNKSTIRQQQQSMNARKTTR